MWRCQKITENSRHSEYLFKDACGRVSIEFRKKLFEIRYLKHIEENITYHQSLYRSSQWSLLSK